MFSIQCQPIGSTISPAQRIGDVTDSADREASALHKFVCALEEIKSCAELLAPQAARPAGADLSPRPASCHLADCMVSASAVKKPDDARNAAHDLIPAYRLGDAAAEKIKTTYKTRTAMDIIQDLFSMDSTQARAFLDQYCFDDASSLNEISLSLHLEQYECLPGWASAFLRSPLLSDEIMTASPPAISNDRQNTDIADSLLLPHTSDIAIAGPSAPKRRKVELQSDVRLSLGKEIDSGFHGVIYEDKYDRAFLIKELRQDGPLASDDPKRLAAGYSSEDGFGIIPAAQRKEAALKEAALFCRYYGEGTAFAFSDGTNAYIRMRKVSGIPVSSVKSFPKDAVERYVDMLEKLNSVGIMHGDLHSDNVLYDAVQKRFQPVDFSDMSADYFGGTDKNKEKLNRRGEQRWSSVIEQIQRKIRGNKARQGAQ